MIRGARCVLVLAATVLLAGCYGDQSDLRNRIERVKQQPGDQIEPLPTIETPPTFEYVAHLQDLRDPFEGADIEAPTEDQQVAGGAGPQPDFNRRREPLESFELDSLEMVGTFFIDEQLFGLVADPDGLLHRVEPEDYMGRNHGQVVTVFEDRIELIELVSDGAGGWRETDAALRLDEE